MKHAKQEHVVYGGVYNLCSYVLTFLLAEVRPYVAPGFHSLRSYHMVEECA